VERVTPALLELFAEVSANEPIHLPVQCALIEAISAGFPALPQFACYDSAFHSTMPRLATLLPIPRRFEALGIRRYGFHGLSCAFVMAELERVAGASIAHGRILLAHLGGGTSVTAVHDGRSVDTTMGYTPAGGTMMGTRPGDLDPGLGLALLRHAGLTPDAYHQLVNHECGLFGVSGGTSDMQTLLAAATHDRDAAEAIALYCYLLRKSLGALAAVLGGVDTIVFTGGIGENAPAIRAQACGELQFLGVTIDPARNAANAPIISIEGSPVAIHVIRTDEESMIARGVLGALHE
jgi:acetate kinase